MMKSNKTYPALFLLIIITSVSWIMSCTHKADISSYPEVCFERGVLPIFLNNCAISHCHEGGGENSLNNYSSIMNYVVSGNANASPVYQVITNTWGINRMPPEQPLTKDNRTIIRLWIEQGAMETTCPAPAATAGIRDYHRFLNN